MAPFGENKSFCSSSVSQESNEIEAFLKAPKEIEDNQYEMDLKADHFGKGVPKLQMIKDKQESDIQGPAPERIPWLQRDVYKEETGLEEKEYDSEEVGLKSVHSQKWPVAISRKTEGMGAGTVALKIETEVPTGGESRELTGLLTHSCAQCSYEFSNLRDLMRHIRTIHSVEELHVCDVCDYKCLGKKALHTHFKVHIYHKSFSCEFCYHKSYFKHDLNDHIRISYQIMLGNNPNSCEICDYKCSDIYLLSKLILQHKPKINISTVILRL